MDLNDRTTLTYSGLFEMTKSMNWIKSLGLNYSDYRSMMAQMAEEGITSGPIQSESLIGYTHLNEARMKRLDKQTLKDSVKLRNVWDTLEDTAKQTWLIMTETWCGDAAQNLPWIELVASGLESIETRYIFRNSHPDLTVIMH